MNDASTLIIFGLLFDIGGAFLVLRPLLYLYKRYWGDEKPDLDSKEMRVFSPEDKEIVREQNTTQSEARIGFTLLVIGFAMQIIGNWKLNPPF